jgi:hypothetical protein
MRVAASPMGLGIGMSRPTAGLGAGAALRSVPDTADRFYLVARGADARIRAIRFQRNVGAAADSANLGVKWPEWRVTGTYILAAFDDAPTSPIATITSDIGAFDLIGNVAGKSFGSYHGLGSAGGLDAETLSIDGLPFDPTTAVRGHRFELVNTVTASDGTNMFTRQLKVTVNANAELDFELMGFTQSGTLTYVRLGMPNGQGSNFTEADLRVGSGWTVAALGTGSCQCVLRGVRAIRVREPSTGNYLVAEAGFPERTGFAYAEIFRDIPNSRTRVYLGRFTGYGGLAGATWRISWGIGAAGAVAPPANMVTNGDFAGGTLTGWSLRFGASGASVVSGAMRQLREAIVHRMGQTNAFALDTGRFYLFGADVLAGSSVDLRVATSPTLNTNTLAVLMPSAPGRLIATYKPDFASMYLGNQFGSGTPGEVLDTDNYIFYQMTA